MSTQGDDAARNLLPRWRYASRSTITAEHAGDPRHVTRGRSSSSHLDAARSAFARLPSVGTALELVHAAATFDQASVAREAVAFLYRHHRRLPEEFRALLGWIDSSTTVPQLAVGPQDNSAHQAQRIIRTNRALLTNDPRNPMRWIDIARAYTVLGNADRAERAIRTAIGLMPNHRVTIRTLARWLVHQGRAEEAWALVTSHPRTRTDPWLMSLEISLASILHRDAAFAIRGRRTVNELTHQPGFISELASSVATLDLQSGDHKRSRKFFRLSLVDPTDNSVAQVQWAAKRDKSLSMDLSVLLAPENIEARYWRAMREFDWDAAMIEAVAWQADEPFSHRPALNGSYVAASLCAQPDIGTRIAEIGLRANPDAQLIRNNLVVSLVIAGNVPDALSHSRLLRTEGHPEYPEFVHQATLGLVAFAVGNIEQGRLHYRSAGEQAPSDYDRRRVQIHRFEGESIANAAGATQLEAAFLDLWQKSKDRMLVTLGRKVMERHQGRLPQSRVLIDPRTNAPLLSPFGQAFVESQIRGTTKLGASSCPADVDENK